MLSVQMKRPRRMLKKERHAWILQQVRLHDRVFCVTLCEEMGVSEDTVRRDLQQLADDGRLLKVHGGGLSPSFEERVAHTDSRQQVENSRIAAHKAAALIHDNMFVLTTGGPIVAEMVKALPAA